MERAGGEGSDGDAFGCTFFSANSGPGLATGDSIGSGRFCAGTGANPHTCPCAIAQLPRCHPGGDSPLNAADRGCRATSRECNAHLTVPAFPITGHDLRCAAVQDWLRDERSIKVRIAYVRR